MNNEIQKRRERIRNLASDYPVADVDDPVDAPMAYSDRLLDARGTTGPAAHALVELEDMVDNARALEKRYLALWELHTNLRGYDYEQERDLLERTAEDCNSASGIIDADPSYVDSITSALVVLGEIDIDPMKNR